jgi:hypothetical protein
MDFSIYNAGGIDYSPAPWVLRMTLVLDEPELRNAGEFQFDRFWSVWHIDRRTYAPELLELTLVLRPGFSNGTLELSGINRFMDYYKAHVEPGCNTKGLHIYMDCFTSIIDHTRYMVLNEPQHLLTVEPEPLNFLMAGSPQSSRSSGSSQTRDSFRASNTVVT